MACTIFTIQKHDHFIGEDNLSTQAHHGSDYSRSPLRTLCGITSSSNTSLARLYTIYNLILVSNFAQLHHTVESLFHHTQWKIVRIPDPCDPDPQRYAMLAVVTRLLVRGFNHRIRKGIWRRDKPSGLELTVRSAIYKCEYFQAFEQVPDWVGKRKELGKTGKELGISMEDLKVWFMG
jgi:hypothetical protein